MEVTFNTVSDCEREVKIQLTKEELKPYFDEAYKTASAKIEIKGFRKGRVPAALIQKMFGESIEYDALDTITNDVFKKTIEEHKLQPIGKPTLSDMEYKRGEPLSFKIKYEVKPTIELKEYKGIEVEKLVHNVTEKEIEDEIKYLQRKNASYENATIVDGNEYIVFCDMQDLDDAGLPVVGTVKENMQFYLNEPSTEKEIKDALKDVKIGDVRKVQFEHKHEDHSHKVHLQLTVKKIEKVLLPEINEEFVKKMTGDKITNVKDFYADIKKNVTQYWQHQYERQMENSLISEIIKRHDFPVPESLIELILDSYLEDIKNKQPNKSLPKNFDRQKFNEAYRTNAIWQVKWEFIREEILKKEKLEVTDADKEKMAEEKSKELNISKEKLLAFYKTSDKSTQEIIDKKLFDVLLKNAAIKEVDDTKKQEQQKITA